MLEHDVLKSLDTGDVVEVGPLMVGITNEPLKGEVVGTVSLGGEQSISIEYSFFGIPLFQVTSKVPK